MTRRDYGVEADSRCETVRRLYTPKGTSHKLCAPCTQVAATSALPSESDEEEEVQHADAG